MCPSILSFFLNLSLCFLYTNICANRRRINNPLLDRPPPPFFSASATATGQRGLKQSQRPNGIPLSLFRDNKKKEGHKKARRKSVNFSVSCETDGKETKEDDENVSLLFFALDIKGRAKAPSGRPFFFLKSLFFSLYSKKALERTGPQTARGPPGCRSGQGGRKKTKRTPNSVCVLLFCLRGDAPQLKICLQFTSNETNGLQRLFSGTLSPFL